ncbi:MAG: ribonuclease H family protein [Proteiniphilum sp.]|jgi:ribonuclease HI|nr:ribonuclease H family protein [Proteiniphilum sp.]NCD14495.1 ribonuclease H [Bacteroidia bacterium]HHT33564.1 ribonuclease H [Bacteroidales bacterium]MDD2725847.1 ribonuclease H family protein [Proteiniphilum sp.]MDD3331928.1 ribonuclease H family protein [Proteiniphilum sp.]
MAQKKYYVVWQGVKPGVYDSWDACKAQVTGYEQALYKSFSSRVEAEQAYSDNPWKHLATKKKAERDGSASNRSIIRQSLAVDAACSGNPGRMEYRGVWVEDGTELFRVGPIDEGTNNIGEFLAIVHALALLHKSEKPTPIYTDSANALKWVAKKKCNTKLKQSDRNKLLFEWIERAEKWLRENHYTNPILKWETKQWGEIPADFGRK